MRPTFHGFRSLDELGHGSRNALGESSQLVLEFWAWFLKNLLHEDKRIRKMAAIATESTLLLVDTELHILVLSCNSVIK